MKPTQFIDRNQKSWDVKFTLGTAMLVDRSDFTALTDQKIILSRFDQDAIQIIVTDTAVLFAVIGIIVRGQCKENFEFEITNEEQEDSFQKKFVDSIDGSCIETARQAFVEALSDFFPAAKTVLSTFLKNVDRQRERVSSRLEKEVLPMMDQMMDNLLDEEMQKLKDKLREKVKETSSPSLPS